MRASGTSGGRRGGGAWLPRLGPLLCAAALLELGREFWRPRPQLDDAYISYRYAQNLLAGHGLVYNPGDPVEGITNLGWTLLVAAGSALGLEEPLVGHVLGLLSGAGLLLACYAYARTGLPPERGALAGLAPWIVLASSSFACWVTSGMETPLFAAAAVAALAAQARGRPGLAAGAAALATWTRPEGVLVAAAVAAGELFAGRWRASGTRRAALLYVASVALLTGFRWLYFGALLPNTFHAKVGGLPVGAGFRYAGDFFADGAVWLLVPAAFAASERRCWPGLAYLGAVTLATVALGGDVFGRFRFLLPVLAVLAALGVVGAAAARRWRPAAGAIAGLCVPLAVWALAIGMPGPLAKGEPIKRQRFLQHQLRWAGGFEARGRELAREMRVRGARLVAAGAIGSLGYHSRLPILDIYGLVDPVIARSRGEAPERILLLPGHQRSNAAYVMGRRPDYILIPRTPLRPHAALQTPALIDIWKHPDLARHYVWEPKLPGYRRRPGPRGRSR